MSVVLRESVTYVAVLEVTGRLTFRVMVKSFRTRWSALTFSRLCLLNSHPGEHAGKDFGCSRESNLS